MDRHRRICVHRTALACFVALCCAAGPVVFEAPASQPAVTAIPAQFLGEWHLAAEPGKPLPPPYGDYLVVLTASLDACTLYKDKGVSRLELAQGVTARRAGGRVTVRFDGPRNQWLELVLGPEDAKPPAAELLANHAGPTVQMPVRLIARE
jgi:hypothetical protein